MTRPVPGTEPVFKISLNRSVTIQLTVLGMLLLYVGIQIAAWAMTGVAKDEFGWVARHAASIPSIAAGVIAAFVAAMAVHELIHGLFFRLFGGRPAYGVGLAAKTLPYAYATSTGSAFSFFEMSIIGVAPFVLISAVTLPLMMSSTYVVGVLSAVVFVANFSGAVGDLWMLSVLWKFRRCADLSLVDTMTGLDIHTPDPAVVAIVARLQSPRRVLIVTSVYRFVLVWGIATGAAIALVGTVAPLLFGLLLNSNTASLIIGPDAFPVLSYIQTPTEVNVGVDFARLAFVTVLVPLVDLWRQLRNLSSKPRVLSPNDGIPRPAVL